MLIYHRSSLILVTFLLEELHTYTTCQVCVFRKQVLEVVKRTFPLTVFLDGIEHIFQNRIWFHVSYMLDSPYNSDLLIF